jgi:membrane protease subunit (stomatin/prohibitin family)
MSLFSFIRKQFVDVIQWTEQSGEQPAVLSYRFPLDDNEIQYGASLTVRDSQIAVFVNEGKVADVFTPGMYKLTTSTMPVLTYLKNWDKLFESPFKSEVYFFSTRVQLDNKWGTPQAITLRDKDFGAVRIRAFGNYSFHLNDAKLFYTHISGTRDICTTADVEGAIRGAILQSMSAAVANSGVAFLDLAANQLLFAKLLNTELAPQLLEMGLKLDTFTVQNVSLPEELQKILDQKIGMGIIGKDMNQLMQFQTAQSIPVMASNSNTGGIAGDVMGLSAGMAMGQVMAQQFQTSLNQPTQHSTQPTQSAISSSNSVVSSQDIFTQLEKLGELKTKGILTEEEFNIKKTELLKKL